MKNEKKTSYISFRVSPREKAEYKKLATDKGISLGKLIRSTIDELLYKKTAGYTIGGVTGGKK